MVNKCWPIVDPPNTRKLTSWWPIDEILIVQIQDASLSLHTHTHTWTVKRIVLKHIYFYISLFQQWKRKKIWKLNTTLTTSRVFLYNHSISSPCFIFLFVQLVYPNTQTHTHTLSSHIPIRDCFHSFLHSFFITIIFKSIIIEISLYLISIINHYRNEQSKAKQRKANTNRNKQKTIHPIFRHVMNTKKTNLFFFGTFINKTNEQTKNKEQKN